jgi:hypothetical protein
MRKNLKAMLEKIIAAAAAKKTYQESLQNLSESLQNIVEFNKEEFLQNLLNEGFVTYETFRGNPDYRRLKKEKTKIWFSSVDIEISNDEKIMSLPYETYDNTLQTAIKLLS